MQEKFVGSFLRADLEGRDQSFNGFQ